MKHLCRLLSLLLILMLLPVSGLAAEKMPTPEELRILSGRLLEAYTAFSEASEELAAIDEQVADLEVKYARDEDNAKLQDQLIDAMIAQEEAAEAFMSANDALVELQSEQQRLAQEAECEDLTVEYDGKYADLLVTATVDENMLIYGLQVTVDGSERDQLVSRDDYLYGFIGHDIPLTIGNGKKDDVAPLQDAQQTSKDLVAALNSLVYTEPEEKGSKTPKTPLIEPQDIADYIFEYGKLPDNFITKKEAQALGWDSSRNYVSDVAPGKSIGGDRFGNYEGLLPDKKGRIWYEADCYYTGGKRNAYRILFSSDGLVYYTDDHYESFTQMHPRK